MGHVSIRLFDMHGDCELCPYFQTDDCGVFDTDLTNEFELAQETFNLTMVDLKRILIDSMKHAFCSEDDKEVLMGLINVYFVDPDRVLDSRRA